MRIKRVRYLWHFHRVNISASSLGAVTLRVKPAVRDLGVTFDSSLKFDKQVNNVVEVSHCLLRLSAKVRPFPHRRELE